MKPIFVASKFSIEEFKQSSSSINQNVEAFFNLDVKVRAI
jgi:hypothetical protein